MTPPPFIGTALRTRDNLPPLTGAGRYAGDVALVKPLHIAFVRSQQAPARLDALDLSEALATEGVVAVHDGRSVAGLGTLVVNPVLPLSDQPDYPVLAAQTVAAVGQPIAAVLAPHPMHAQDGADAVHATLSDIPFTPRRLAQQTWQHGTIDWGGAAHVVSHTLTHARLAPAPLEPRSIAVSYDPAEDSVVVWHSTQTPHRSRSELAAILRIDPARIRVIAQQVGGAFGMKGSLYPEEVFAVWAAFHHRRDVKWVATRSEEFLSATQGRGIHSEGRLALDTEGRFLGLEARIRAPIGPWLPNSGLIPAWNAARILPGGYDIPALDLRTEAVTQPGGPVGIYRGAGRPEAALLLERLVDKAACATGLDPVELRRRNLLQPHAMPHKTATGDTRDSGDYPTALATLCAAANYSALRTAQADRRLKGDLVGVGLGFYVEPSGSGWESARVTLQADGTVQVDSGSSCQGHGRETAFAQITADALGGDVALRDIAVQFGDTGQAPPGIGALASRSTAIGGSAVWEACTQARARQTAGEPLPLTAEVRYENKGQAWGYGAYLVMLSICPDTGDITIEQAHCVDDAGRIVNPALLKGQVLGGFAQGWGEAMREEVRYDADGQLLTGSFMDYAMPRAADLPPLSITTLESPSPMNTLGAKGVGEAGTIGAPPAILNAAIDALSPLGITDLMMPLTPCRIWQTIREAQEGATR